MPFTYKLTEGTWLGLCSHSHAVHFAITRHSVISLICWPANLIRFHSGGQLHQHLTVFSTQGTRLFLLQKCQNFLGCEEHSLQKLASSSCSWSQHWLLCMMNRDMCTTLASKYSRLKHSPEQSKPSRRLTHNTCRWWTMSTTSGVWNDQCPAVKIPQDNEFVIQFHCCICCNETRLLCHDKAMGSIVHLDSETQVSHESHTQLSHQSYPSKTRRLPPKKYAQQGKGNFRHSASLLSKWLSSESFHFPLHSVFGPYVSFERLEIGQNYHEK